MDPEDGYERLRGNKIQNLGNGLLVGAIPEHHAVDFGPRHQVAHVSDDAFRVGLVDQQGDHVDVNGVLLAPQRPDVPVGDVASASQDHRNVQDGHFLRGAATSLLLGCRRVRNEGHHHQEGQGEQRTITTTATAAAPSTPPLTPFAAEGHTAKPLHPLHGDRMRRGVTEQMKIDRKRRKGWEGEEWKDDGGEKKRQGRKIVNTSPHTKAESFFFIRLSCSVIKHINLVGREVALRGSCGGVIERKDD